MEIFKWAQILYDYLTDVHGLLGLNLVLMARVGSELRHGRCPFLHGLQPSHFRHLPECQDP